MSDPKDYLRKMIDHTIDGDMEGAEQAFKDYLVPKTKEVMGMAPAPEMEPTTQAEPVAEEPAVEEPAVEPAVEEPVAEVPVEEPVVEPAVEEPQPSE